VKTALRFSLLPILISLYLGSAFASEAPAMTKAGVSGRISEQQARDIARQKFPDSAFESAELETEGGALIWSIDVRPHGSNDIRELQIDAHDGHLIRTEIETPADQAAEKAADLAAEHAAKPH
jgi:hypothetical protein